jgi:hypothetical protein
VRTTGTHGIRRHSPAPLSAALRRGNRLPARRVDTINEQQHEQDEKQDGGKSHQQYRATRQAEQHDYVGGGASWES